MEKMKKRKVRLIVIHAKLLVPDLMESGNKRGRWVVGDAACKKKNMSLKRKMAMRWRKMKVMIPSTNDPPCTALNEGFFYENGKKKKRKEVGKEFQQK